MYKEAITIHSYVPDSVKGLSNDLPILLIFLNHLTMIRALSHRNMPKHAASYNSHALKSNTADKVRSSEVGFSYENAVHLYRPAREHKSKRILMGA